MRDIDPMQLVDELSMIYTTCIMFYATFSYAKSARFSVLLGIFLVSLAIFITLYYHYLQDPEFHQNAYALLTAIVLLRSMYVMEINIRPSFRSKGYGFQQQRNANVRQAFSKENEVRDLETLKDMWLMIACGLSIFLGGFGIWTLDNAYCSNLRRWRRQLGLPWGVLLEGHGWW
jgi:dihydroceramidase